MSRHVLPFDPHFTIGFEKGQVGELRSVNTLARWKEEVGAKKRRNVLSLSEYTQVIYRLPLWLGCIR